MLDTLKNLMEVADGAITEIEKLYNSSTEKHSTLDKYVVQLLHEIELNDFDAVGMAKQIKELKSVLKLRRKYKDQIDYFLGIRGFVNKSNFEKATKGLETVIKNKKDRKFKDRISEKLREEIIDEASKM